MFRNFPGYVFVVCLTFSSMMQPFAHPTAVKDDHMYQDLQLCPSSPAKIYNLITHEDFSQACSGTKPVLNNSLPMPNDLEFFFVKYLCMELYDLSLQLCKIDSNYQVVASTCQPNATDFCTNLRFPVSRDSETRVWADIAILNLKNKTICAENCMRKERISPICKAIYCASESLISILEKNPVAPASQLSSDAKASVLPSFTNHMPKAQAGPRNATNSSNLRDLLTPKVVNTSIKDEIKPVMPNSGKVELNIPSEENLTSRIMQNQGVRGEESISLNMSPSGGEEKAVVFTDMPALDSTTSSVVVTAGTESFKKELGIEHDDISLDSPMGRENGENLGVAYPKNTPDIDSGNSSPKENEEENREENNGDGDYTFSSSENGISRIVHDPPVDPQGSNFFAYFLTMIVLCIVGYLVFHNKQKIIALALEGRRMQGSRRRPNTSSYKKLDSNLEEAVTSSCSSSSVTRFTY